MMKKLSLTKDYLVFSCLCVAIVSAVYGAVIFRQYNALRDNNQKLSSTSARQISNNIKNFLEYVNNTNLLVGNQIAKTSGKDLKLIHKIFTDTRNHHDKYQNMFSWSLFDWVDANNRQLVNSKNGISKNPPDMSQREYSWKAPQNPWTLQVSFPALGNPSNEWVIPAGTGITNEQDKFIGSVVVGINVAQFIRNIGQGVNENINFLIIDNHRNIMNHTKQDLEELSKFPQNIDITDMSTQPEYEAAKYFSKQQVSNYPYIILTGYDKSFLQQQFYDTLLPRIIEYLLVIGLFLPLLFIFRKRLINPIHNMALVAEQLSSHSNVTDVKIPRNNPTIELHQLAKAMCHVKRYKQKLERQKTHLTEVNQELVGARIIIDKSSLQREKLLEDLCKVKADTLKEIMQLSTRLKDFHDKKNNVHLIPHAALHIIKQIEDLSFDLFSLSSDIVEIKPVDIKPIIDDVLLIQQHKLINQKIQVSCNIDDNLPQISGDSLRLRQIFVGLIHQMIILSEQVSVDNKFLNIYAHAVFNENGKQELIVELKSNFTNYTEEEKITLTNGQYYMHVNRTAKGDDLSIMAIARLIKAHKGNLSIHNTSITKISLPTAILTDNSEQDCIKESKAV